MLLPLALPPGQYRNGTDYQAKGRWRDGNLVRWRDGVLQPVKGWVLRETPAAAAPRAAIAWSDLSGTRRYALGTYGTLVAVTEDGAVADITPADLVGGTGTGSSTGFGGGTYGSGFYGTPRPDAGPLEVSAAWTMDTWGELLIACSDADGRLLEWGLGAGDAVAVTNAPTGNAAVLVTEERFLVALGAGANGRKVQWSDREDRNLWTPAAENEAGDIELQTPGRIMCAERVRGQALILTDQDAHTMTYQGPPFVYGFERVGSACGVVSRQGLAPIGDGAMWMGQRGFFRFLGGQVQDVPCDVADHVFGDINRAEITKVFAVGNARYSEVWFFYPSGASTECDRYVAFAARENVWMTGTLARTAGIDAGTFANPIWFDTSGAAYDHEIGLNYDGAEVFAESGPVELGDGEAVMRAVKLIPDEGTQGQVEVTFKARFQPNAAEASFGPYAMADETSVRFTGRQVAMRVSGAQLADWRWGVPRLEVVAGGRR